MFGRWFGRKPTSQQALGAGPEEAPKLAATATAAGNVVDAEFEEIDAAKDEAARDSARREAERRAALETENKRQAVEEAVRQSEAREAREAAEAERARRAAIEAENQRQAVEAERARLAALEAERVRKAAEEEARQAAEAERERLQALEAERARQAAEAEAARVAAEAERARRAAIEVETQRQAAEAERTRLAALEAERARKAAEEEARQAAEAERERLQALEAERTRQAAEAEAARVAAEAERARLAAIEAEHARRAAEEQARAAAAEAERLAAVAAEQARAAAAEAARIAAEQEAARIALEQALRAAAEKHAEEVAAMEAAAARQAAEEEAARKAAEEEAARKAVEEEAARQAAQLAAKKAAIEVPKDYVPAPESGHALYQVDLDSFAGPLDLLLFLIRRHELDVFDIPMAFVCERYLEYLKVMEDLNIDVASEFMFMAAELLHIKSRMLLPSTDDVEDEEEVDPRAELVRRLLEYQKFKSAAETLDRFHWFGRDTFGREPERLVFDKSDVPLKEVSIFALIEAFDAVLSRQKPEFRHQVVMEQASVALRMRTLVTAISGQRPVNFQELLGPLGTRLDIVVTFLALLEMTRLQLLRVYESDTGELYLAARFASEAEANERLQHVSDETLLAG
ncbi:MAG: segregation/condensation protein A [Deltaproteobacteria bacterium]|nr:segregation/condensation protein A [Deltaproteobacteria bacterium]